MPRGRWFPSAGNSLALDDELSPSLHRCLCEFQPGAFRIRRGSTVCGPDFDTHTSAGLGSAGGDFSYGSLGKI